MGTRGTLEELRKIEALFCNDKTSGTETVKCPKCGKKLVKTFYGNSSAVECETEGCLYYTFRGI